MDISKLLHAVRKEIKVPMKQFMKALRHALTGYKDGPSIPDIVKVLGKERVLRRLQKIIDLKGRGERV